MSRPLRRVELWSNLACASGVAVAVVPVAGCEVTHGVEDVLVTHRLALTVPDTWEDVGELVERRVVRLVFAAGTGAGAFDEYRITSISRASGTGRGLVTVRGVGVEFDLVDGGKLVQRAVGAVVEYRYPAPNADISDQWTDHLDAAAPSYITAGTFTPTVLVNPEYDGDTALSGLQRCVRLANALTGDTYLIAVDRNGVTDYLVSVTDYNASAAAVDLRTGKNLQGVTRATVAGSQTTRVQVIGADGSGIGNNHWEVDSVSAGVHVDVVDINGGLGPAQEADQFNGAYWIDTGGTAHAITDTQVVDAQTTRLLMASTAGITAGDWGRIAADSSGNELQYVEAVADTATYGTVLGTLRSDQTRTLNILQNPGFHEWGSPPPGWTVTSGGGVYAEETGAGLWLFGGRSLKLTVATMTPYNERVWQVRTGGEYFRWDCWVSVISSGGAAASVVTFQFDGGTIPGGSFDLNDYVGRGWTRLTQSAFCGAGSRTFRVSAQLAGVIYLAGAAVCPVSSLVEEPPFTRGSGAAQMLQQGVAHLLETSSPPVAYEVDLLDLYRADPDGIGAYEALVLNGPATVTDTDLGVTLTPRVIEITERHVRDGLPTPLDTSVRLATRRPDLPRLLAA